MKRRTFLTRLASVLGLATAGSSITMGEVNIKYRPMTLADIPKDNESYYDLSIAVVVTLDKSLEHPAGPLLNKLSTHYAIDSEVYLMRNISGGWRFDSLRSLRRPIEISVKSPQRLLERAINTEELTAYKFETLPEFFDFASEQLKSKPVKLGDQWT